MNDILSAPVTYCPKCGMAYTRGGRLNIGSDRCTASMETIDADEWRRLVRAKPDADLTNYGRQVLAGEAS